VSLFVEAAPDSSLPATEASARAMVDVVRTFPETNYAWSMTLASGGFGGMVAKDWRTRARSTPELYGELFGAVSQVPGVRVFPRLDPPLPTSGQYDVELVLQGDLPPEQMLGPVQATVEAARRSGRFLYVDTDLKLDLPEARVTVDRERLADLGLDLAGVGQELGTLLGGNYVNRFNYFDRAYKVIPQIGGAGRATVGPLLDLKIRTPSGALTPVSSFASITPGVAPRTLNRFQQKNSAKVFGGVAPGVTKEEGLRTVETAAAAAVKPGMTIDHAGESRQIRKEGASLTKTLGFAIVLIYLVLAAQFRSFRDPLVVLLGSAPLAIAGALAFSYVGLTTVNIYSQVGLITLVGLIAKNGILVVEFANTLRERGLDKLTAVREAASTRLRPILMTSAATVFGHLPLVLVEGPGARARNSIGVVLVAGMVVGTLLTLFVVPVFYTLLASDRSPQTDEAFDAEHGLTPADLPIVAGGAS
jgi:multidrug efflux pump